MINTSPVLHEKLILRGIHLNLTDALRASITAKVSRLLRHDPRLIRVRIDVDAERRGQSWAFIAKGEVELEGPNLCASVTTDNGYRAVDLLISKLDRMLRKRATARRRSRSSDDIRRPVAEADLVTAA